MTYGFQKVDCDQMWPSGWKTGPWLCPNPLEPQLRFIFLSSDRCLKSQRHMVELAVSIGNYLNAALYLSFLQGIEEQAERTMNKHMHKEIPYGGNKYNSVWRTVTQMTSRDIASMGEFLKVNLRSVRRTPVRTSVPMNCHLIFMHQCQHCFNFKSELYTMSFSMEEPSQKSWGCWFCFLA